MKVIRFVIFLISFLLILLICSKYLDYKHSKMFTYMVNTKLFYVLLMEQEEKRDVKLLKRYILDDLIFDLKLTNKNDLKILNKRDFCKKIQHLNYFFKSKEANHTIENLCR